MEENILTNRIKSLHKNGCNIQQIAMLTGATPTSINQIISGTKIFLNKRVRVTAKKKELISVGIDSDCKGLVGVVDKVFNNKIYVKFTKDCTFVFTPSMLSFI